MLRSRAICSSILLYSALLTLAGCNLVSESEIKTRIETALPESRVVELKYLRSTPDCIFAKLSIEPYELKSMNFADESHEIDDEYDLGRIWIYTESLDALLNYSKSKLEEDVSRDLSATILEAKECAIRNSDFQTTVYDTPGYISYSRNRNQIVFLFGDNRTIIVYFVGGI